jgi:hypothetical protein
MTHSIIQSTASLRSRSRLRLKGKTTSNVVHDGSSPQHECTGRTSRYRLREVQSLEAVGRNKAVLVVGQPLRAGTEWDRLVRREPIEE